VFWTHTFSSMQNPPMWNYIEVYSAQYFFSPISWLAELFDECCLHSFIWYVFYVLSTVYSLLIVFVLDPLYWNIFFIFPAIFIYMYQVCRVLQNHVDDASRQIFSQKLPQFRNKNKKSSTSFLEVQENFDFQLVWVNLM
jgi:hypothetical protein